MRAAAPVAPLESAPKGQAAQDLVDEAYKFWQESDEFEQERRVKYKKNLRMLTMQQWEDKDKEARESAGRPIVTDDRLTPAVQSIVNSARENRPSAKVHPINEQADEDTAQVIEGGIRHIEYASQASIAYDTAFESAVGRGWGFFRITTDYCEDGSFDNQEVRVEEVANTLSVYPDRNAVRADLSDSMGCVILHIWTHDRYIRTYGGKDDLVVAGFQASNGDTISQWVNAETVTMCEYWKVVLVPKTKVLVERFVQNPPDPQSGAITGQLAQVVFDDKEEYLAKNEKAGDRILKERPWNDRRVEQYFLTADQVKEKRIFASKWIPIIRVTGKMIYDDQGKLRLVSAIEHAIPSQQVLNVYASFEGESVALAGRPKWMGPIGSMKTNASSFQNHNRANITSLEYDPVEVAPGVMGEKPEWVTFNPNIEFCLAGKMSAVQSIQATTMVFDPELGHNSTPDQSGTAINALQKKAQQGNFHFFDNLTRAQWHGYRIMIDLFPKIYDSAREIGWLGADQKRAVVKVNQPYTDPQTGKTKTHMLDAGNYGVIVDPGPSYDSQRLEADAFLEQAMGIPVYSEKCPDLLVKLKDLGEIGDEIAKRVAPPGYGDDDQDDPVKMKQALAQLTQQSQQMTGVIHQLMQEKESNILKLQADMAKAKMQEEHADYRAITVAEITQKTQLGLLEGKNAQDALAAQLGFTQSLHDSAHEAGMAAMDHGHQVIQQQQQGDQAQDMAAQQQAAQAQQPTNQSAVA